MEANRSNLFIGIQVANETDTESESDAVDIIDLELDNETEN